MRRCWRSAKELIHQLGAFQLRLEHVLLQPLTHRVAGCCQADELVEELEVLLGDGDGPVLEGEAVPGILHLPGQLQPGVLVGPLVPARLFPGQLPLGAQLAGKGETLRELEFVAGHRRPVRLEAVDGIVGKSQAEARIVEGAGGQHFLFKHLPALPGGLEVGVVGQRLFHQVGKWPILRGGGGQHRRQRKGQQDRADGPDNSFHKKTPRGKPDVVKFR